MSASPAIAEPRARPVSLVSLSDAHGRRDARALLTFAVDGTAYVAGVAGAVVVRPLAGKLLFSILTAAFITRLFILAHDACHGSFTSSRRLNGLVGRLAFLPSLTPFNLWQLGHNTLHHGYTNLKGRDYVWTPVSKAEFDALPPGRQRLERAYRSLLGHGLYYLVEIWWARMIRPAERAAVRRRFDQRDRRLVIGFAAAASAGTWWAAVATAQDPVPVVLTALALPFALWNMGMGFLIFMHHTHPQVAWFDDRAQWKRQAAQLRQAVHVAFPESVDALLHHIMDHTAHHVDTGVPSYRLREAQAALEARYPAEVPVQRFSWAHLRRCVAVCKLYDYEHHRWLDFDGRVTAEVSVKAEEER
jgi:acyl-lipid omega-6 desaturase (Delta-12 desaturase)